MLKYLRPEFEHGRAEIVLDQDKKIIGVKLRRLGSKILLLKYLDEDCLNYLKERNER